MRQQRLEGIGALAAAEHHLHHVLSSPYEAGLLLPSVTGELTIEGNGAEIRSYADGAVALFEVGREGDVTLRNPALAVRQADQ